MHFIMTTLTRFSDSVTLHYETWSNGMDVSRKDDNWVKNAWITLVS